MHSDSRILVLTLSWFPCFPLEFHKICKNRCIWVFSHIVKTWHIAFLLTWKVKILISSTYVPFGPLIGNDLIWYSIWDVQLMIVIFNLFLVQNTSLTPPRIVEVSLTNVALGVSFYLYFYYFPIGFWNCSHGVVFLFLLYSLLNTDYQYMYVIYQLWYQIVGLT